jgi:hypothetical protein
MHARSFMRLANAFSKEVENHAHAVVTKCLWEIGDIVDVPEAWEASNGKL